MLMSLRNEDRFGRAVIGIEIDVEIEIFMSAEAS